MSKIDDEGRMALWCIHNPDKAAEEIERLRGVLGRIAEQQLVDERLVEGGDYEYGYEQIVKLARAALAQRQGEPR